MSQYDYDLFVIGAGSGGVRASRMSAQAGARVAIAEDRYLGGTCVNVGCVPKKLFVYASQFPEAFHDSAGFGWQVNQAANFNWPVLRDNKTTEITRLNGIYASLLEGAGVDLIEGRAKLTGNHSVVVNGKEYTAERILIATGGWPFVPDFPGNEYVVDSNGVFSLEEFPERAVVVGGGYIALEFAGIFAGLGVDTHLVYRGEKPLRGFDTDVRDFVLEEVAKKGIRYHFQQQITAIEKNQAKGYQVTFASGETIQSDLVLYATGRVPNLTDLGLENAGVALDERGYIAVDDYYQTNVPSIYALGDVIGRVQLTPVAIAEAMVFAKNCFAGENAVLDYNNIPTAVFSQPNVATVGLSEAQAVERFTDVDIYLSTFRPMKNTLSGNTERTLMKLIVDAKDDRVLGVHMVGPEAGEIIQGLAVAVKAGATKAVFDQTIGIHPTAAEEFVTMRQSTRQIRQ